ncbi:glutamate 5-kinase [Sphingomonas sp. I4]
MVKVGSALLVTPEGDVRRDWLTSLVADIAARVRQGQQIAIVSSGAIALGARRLGLPKGGRASLEDAQAAAATGQIALSQTWAELLHAENLTAAQMLVTLDDLEDRRRYLNAAATLGRLLGLGVVPVINENDSVATEEIRFGDNDRLAARVGQAAGANGVLLLSDVDGLYDLESAHESDRPAYRTCRADRGGQWHGRWWLRLGHGLGRHGVQDRRRAYSGECWRTPRHRVGPDRPSAVDARAPHHLCRRKSAPARKAWLAGGLTARGAIFVDAGAAKALAEGNSLLAAGATAVQGHFARGDLVTVEGPDGTIARGLSEYDSTEARALVGTRSDQQAEILGHAPRAALIHRNHLALL